jgi:DNA-binding FrmR family transcriptional regulator
MQTEERCDLPPVEHCGPGAEHEPHHAEITRRLHRVTGQLAGIGSMYEENRYCIDILDQIASARAALGAVAALILDDHINACVREAVEQGRPEEKVEELMSTMRRFLHSV